MKIIVAGSRNVKSSEVVFIAIDEILLRENLKMSLLVSGGARGVDTIAENWAILNNVEKKRFIPDWKTYGLSAGHRRNREMGDFADALIAIWDGKSSGTKGMIEYMNKLKKPAFIKIVS